MVRRGLRGIHVAVDVRGENVVVGLIPKGVKQFSYTRWISMSRILAYDGTQNWPPEDVGMFYARWGLLHYLMSSIADSRPARI